jgi:hypothetical protein
VKELFLTGWSRYYAAAAALVLNKKTEAEICPVSRRKLVGKLNSLTAESDITKIIIHSSPISTQFSTFLQNLSRELYLF